MTPLNLSGGSVMVSKVKTHNRALNGNTGDVAYTGYGFKPTALMIYAGEVGGDLIHSRGFCDSSLGQMCAFCGTAGIADMDTAVVARFQDFVPTYGQSAIVKSLDNDGFTLTWTKTGNQAGTITLIVLALK